MNQPVTETSPEVKPEIAFIFDLVKQLTTGRIQIPRFQRPFVWRRSQMLDLLDSIRRQYPIGSLLTWETEDPIAALPMIGPVAVPTPEGGAAPAFVLDGHQRLSTLAGALIETSGADLGEDSDPGRWRIAYNARDQKFEHVAAESTMAPYQFPLTKLMDTLSFLEECQRVLNSAGPEDGRRYVANLQEVARRFQNYRIPVIRIRDTGLTEAVEIFARLNSKGQGMSADQMVSALLYRQRDGDVEFDLSSEIDSIMEMLNLSGFGLLDRTVVLRSLLASIGEDVYRTDWTRISRERRAELLERLREAIPLATASLEMTLAFLVSEIGLDNGRLLPYSMQVVVLSAFFNAQPSPSEAQLAALRQWYWASAYSGWFGGANSSQVNSVIKEMRGSFANDPTGGSIRTIDLAAHALPIPAVFDMRSARTRLLILAMLSLDPRARNGQVMRDPQGLVARFWPDAIGPVFGSKLAREQASSPANRMLRDPSEDKGQSSNWLRQLDAKTDEALLRSHAISPDAFQSLLAEDAGSFVQRRLTDLIEMELEVMRRLGVTPPKDSAPAVAPLDDE
jgi:Protein of unknown function DUF262